MERKIQTGLLLLILATLAWFANRKAPMAGRFVTLPADNMYGSSGWFGMVAFDSATGQYCRTNSASTDPMQEGIKKNLQFQTCSELAKR